MTAINQLRAFLKRDSLLASYSRLAFAWQVFTVVLVAPTLYYLGRLIRPAASPHLVPYGGDYFAFVILGVALFGLLDADKVDPGEIDTEDHDAQQQVQDRLPGGEQDVPQREARCQCRQRDWGAHEHLQRTDHLLLPHRRGGGPHDGGEQSEERHTQDDEGEVVAPVGDQVR